MHTILGSGGTIARELSLALARTTGNMARGLVVARPKQRYRLYASRGGKAGAQTGFPEQG